MNKKYYFGKADQDILTENILEKQWKEFNELTKREDEQIIEFLDEMLGWWLDNPG